MARNSILVLRILTELGRGDQLPLAAISTRIAAPKTSVYRALLDLMDEGWVHGSSSRPPLYFLSTKVLTVSRGVGLARSLTAAASSVLDRIHLATGENVQLSFLEGDSLVGFERRESTHAVRVVLPLGTRIPWYATAVGKAMAGHLPPERLEQLLSAEHPPLTAQTITDRERLLREVDKGIRNGYVVSRSGYRDGLISIGAAIVDQHGDALAGLSMNGVDTRITDEVVDELGAMIRDGAHEISRALEGSAD